jgi:hypothetical protein
MYRVDRSGCDGISWNSGIPFWNLNSVLHHCRSRGPVGLISPLKIIGDFSGVGVEGERLLVGSGEEE